MRKLFLLASLLGVAVLAAWTPRAEAIGASRCDLYCPTATGRCSCPPWTDRPGVLTTCSGWNRVGSCWYE